MKRIPHTYRVIYRGIGRTKVEITCVKCGRPFDGFLWSLAGSGKRCPYCKTKHNHYAGLIEESAPPPASAPS
jgi:DNA-directed RNA polymerase subunit RPC12/RpoP